MSKRYPKKERRSVERWEKLCKRLERTNNRSWQSWYAASDPYYWKLKGRHKR